jgi:large subunit ribosomal protein L4
MEQLNIVNQKGETVSFFSLNPELWQLPLSRSNISLTNRYYLANQRQGTKKTKSKGEVSGGGRKPWKQKGTGRARQGSIRAPQFRGGGIVFGPRGEENYSLNINQKTKKKVLLSLLSEKIRKQEVIVIDKILLENHKTKEAEKLLTNLLGKKTHSLIVLGNNEENKEKLKNAFRNLPYIKIADSKSINLLQALPSTCLIFTNLALLETEKRLNYLH